MYKIHSCPVCKSSNIDLAKSKLAQFVAWRTTQNPINDNIDNNAVICKDCNFIGSQLRFTYLEEQNLYKDYRGNEYNKLRIICEPNYIERINSFNQDHYINKRMIGIESLIHKHVNSKNIKTVLDFGGDSGTFIPSYFKESKKYVFDISGIETLPSIEKLNLNTALTVDFLMCCHVIEHLSDLEKIFKDIELFINENSWVYFEVPNYPSPSVPSVFHEHINIFNKQSFSKLLIRHNFKIIDTFENENLCIITKKI